MWSSREFVWQIEYATGEVVEFAFLLDVLEDLGLFVFDISVDSRAFGTGWIDRYDDIQRKNFRLK
jgi:alkyl hydroperoxide reductase subunit AhpC